MFNFKTVSILFSCVVAALLLLEAYFEIGIIPYLVIVLIYLAAVTTGVTNIRSGFFVKTICFANTKEKIIALTFDDGPAEYTPAILDILKEYNVKTTFFCIGKRIESNKDIFKRIINEGHIAGNHSYYHNFRFDFWSSQKIIEDLKKTEMIIQGLISKKVKFFRPPYGITNPLIKKAAQKMNYTVVGWSLRSFDTIHNNREKLLGRLKRKLKPGSVILLHDSQKITVEILKDFLDFTISDNYTIKRLDELIKTEAYEN